MHSIVLIIGSALGVAALVGCAREVDEAGAGRAETHLVPNVVARVGGRPIGAAELESRMQSEEIGADAALEQLIDEELLAQEAERLGFTVSGEGQRAVERIMVRAMLRDMETENTPESISDQELREDYARYEDKFRIPERRRSWHILVKGHGEEARSLAESILRELRKAKNPREVFERYANGGSEDLDLEVSAEDLPAVSEAAALEKPYKDAIFAVESEGPLKEVVETSYGWHAIVVAEIMPAEQRTLAEVEEQSRERLSQAKRLAALVRTVQALKAEGLVEYDDEGVERLLSMGGLPERSD